MTMEKTAKIWAGAALAAAVVMIAATFSIVFGQSGREKGRTCLWRGLYDHE